MMALRVGCAQMAQEAHVMFAPAEAGQIATMRPFGVHVDAVASAGRMTTTGAIPRSANSSACSRLFAERLMVNPLTLAVRTDVAFPGIVMS